jgi:hypothetical protein
MKKIKLNLDDLQVQSFATTEEKTMKGLSDTGNTTSNGCSLEDYWTQYCGTSDTCDASCYSGMGVGCNSVDCSLNTAFYCYGSGVYTC